MAKLHSVRLMIPPRPGYSGYWALGRHFPEGIHEVSGITSAQLRSLREDHNGGRAAILSETSQGADDEAPAEPEKLTPEERAVIAAHRASRQASQVQVKTTATSVSPEDAEKARAHAAQQEEHEAARKAKR
jgi:hypothetical protein